MAGRSCQEPRDLGSRERGRDVGPDGPNTGRLALSPSPSRAHPLDMPSSLSSRSPSNIRQGHPVKTDAGPPLGEFVLLNGQRVFIRPIEPTDATALADFHDHLSPASIHSRFFGAHPHLAPLEASTFATVDGCRRMAFVALDGDTVVGVGRYDGSNDQRVAEVAFVVADRFQGQGLATIFLSLLVEHALSNGYEKFVAQVLTSNWRMQEVFAHSGLAPSFRRDMDVVDVVLNLRTGPESPPSCAVPVAGLGGGSSVINDEQDVVPASEMSTLPSDLGRRVRFWRERSKMTREKLAEKAGMSVEYLEYLETQSTGEPSVSAIARTAAVLGISVAELLGGSVERAPGGAPAVRQPHLVVLEPDRSWALLGNSGVGRIVFNSADGPVALPVNYAVSGRDILLRTCEDTVIARIDTSERVSFEADRIDDAMSKGWSVVVQATCEQLGADCKMDETFGMLVDPWAGGRRQHWVRLRARSIAGRAVETDL